MGGKTWLKTAVIITTVFVLLAGAVFAVFNGIIEIIEETLGNIVNFLSNPLGFINQLAQDAWNSFTTFRPGILVDKVYKVDDSETCRFFLSSEMVDQLAENLSSGGVLTDDSSFYKGVKHGAGSILGGQPGEFKRQGNMDTDGYEQTYTSSAGLTFIDYKQNVQPWKNQKYGESDIGHYGCGITSIATLLSGLGYDKTPAHTGREMSSTGDIGYLQGLGVNATWKSGAISASEIANILKSGKIIAMHYKSSFFSMGAKMHFISIVDVDSQGRFLVLNPYYVPGGPNESGWFSARDIESGNYERVEIDVSSKIKDKGETSKESIYKESIYTDTTMLNGALDLEKTGLEKVALRDMVLASYVTQATTDTVVGVEVPVSEMEEKCPSLKRELDNYTMTASVPGASAITDLLAFPSKLIADIRIKRLRTG